MGEKLEGSREENVRKWDCCIRGGTDRGSKKRDILIEGAVIELGRNLVLGKLPGIHNDVPS